MTKQTEQTKPAQQEQATPGPWTCTIHCDTSHSGCFATVSMHDGVIANVQTWRSGIQGTNEETKANARLIAASPAMYEALRELCAIPNKKRPNRVWDEARAALAQATDEASQ